MENKFANTKKNFVMNPFPKRSRSVDREEKLSPANQKSKKEDAQPTPTKQEANSAKNKKRTSKQN